MHWLWRMKHGMGRLLGRFVRVRAESVGDPQAMGGRSQVESVRYVMASEMCAEARLAMVRGDLQAAEQHIEHAADLSPSHPEVVEISTRLAMQRGAPEQAIGLLERLAKPSPRHRLLLQLARLQTGQRALAHLDLQQWSHRPNFPPNARVLLAWLDWQAGSIESARRAIRLAGDQGSDPDLLRLRMLIELDDGNHAAARRTGGKLGLQYAGDPLTNRFLASFQRPQSADGLQVSIQMIEELSFQLGHDPRLIDTLIAAQRIKPSPERIELLRRAIGRIADDLNGNVSICEAMAELASLAGDEDDARRWARRGLKQRPYSAKLAMLLDRLGDDQDDQAGASISIAILRQVADEHPDYADVQRQLINRYRERGLNTLAKRRLTQWLSHRPEDRHALQIKQELVA